MEFYSATSRWLFYNPHIFWPSGLDGILIPYMRQADTLAATYFSDMLNFFKKMKFKFLEPENTACFTCDHVIYRLRPILFVSHESEDGSWQFLCGQHDHTNSNIKIVSLKNMTKIDSTINDLYEMPHGFAAERETIKSPWKPFRLIN